MLHFSPLPHFVHLVFLFFIAVWLFWSVVFKSILAHSLTKSHANRSTCVYVCVRARMGSCFASVCVCCVCWDERSPGSPSWQERISRTLYTDSPRVWAAFQRTDMWFREDIGQAGAAAASNYLATVSDFQENIFFPEKCWPEWKQNIALLALSSHNHSKATAGNLKYGPN